MMSVQNVACTATFMMEGMLAVEKKYRQYGLDGRSTHDLYTVWDQGGIELHMEICKYAELAEKACMFILAEGTYEFPGVYDYEVSEPFGEYFANHLFTYGMAPTEIEAADQLLKETARFFTQCEDDPVFEAGALYNKLGANL